MTKPSQENNGVTDPEVPVEPRSKRRTNMMRVVFCVVCLVGAVLAQTPQPTPTNGIPYELPYGTVDCDNANGDPKLCTVEGDNEADQAKGVCTDPNAKAVAPVSAASPTPQAFPKSTMTMNAMPVSIIGGNGAATGSETDALIAALHPFSIGETTIVSNKLSFIGGRADLTITAVSKWIQKHSSTNGYKFQIGPTVSFGGVKANSKFYYGERAGIFVNYSLAWAVGMQFEVQWNNFPGYAHNVPSFTFGPNCHW